MKILTVILCASALLSSSGPSPQRDLPPLQKAETKPDHGGQLFYRVQKSKRSERTVAQNTVRQRGFVTLTVGDRPKHQIDYESVQTFQIGLQSTVLRVTDDAVKVKADFTLSEDGSTSTFAFNGAAVRTLTVNPDETVTLDGSTYGSPEMLAAAVVEQGCVPPNGLESLVAAIEIANAELGNVNKGKKAKSNLKKALKWLMAIAKAIAENLD